MTPFQCFSIEDLLFTLPPSALKPSESVEAYCLDCSQFHLTCDEVGGTSDFPVAQCPECEARWESLLAAYGTPVIK